MEDSKIIELYWQRSESALAETHTKYGRYCHSIANNILHNIEDAEESVNDTYNAAWNSIPPHRPTVLSTYLGKITRRLALKKYRSRNAEKRKGDLTSIALDELEECIPSAHTVDEHLSAVELAETLNDFLATLSLTERRVFLRRYWYFDSVKAIAARFGFSESKVKMMLKRTRDKLMLRLQKEDIYEP